MTSRERVIKAIMFQKPDRVPRDLPEPWGSDIILTGPAPDPAFRPKTAGEDEWGCVWEKLANDKTKGQVKVHPLKDYSMLDNFKFPDYKLPSRYAHIKEISAKNKGQKFILAETSFSLIHRLEYMRGHNEAWTDSYLYPEEMGRLLDKFSDIAIDSIDRLAECGVDGFFSCDDWGLQERLILKPEVFREFFKPRYKRVYEHARGLGLYTFLHSCGYIIDILGDLLESGLQVIQMDQQENMGTKNLSEKFGGKLCFWCPVDIQKTMITGSLDDIRNYARNLIDSFGRFNGGFIAKWYPAPDAVGHTMEKVNAMAETFVKYGEQT